MSQNIQTTFQEVFSLLCVHFSKHFFERAHLYPHLFNISLCTATNWAAYFTDFACFFDVFKRFLYVSWTNCRKVVKQQI